MPREDAPNPFRKEACPDLHAAWKGGFQAYLAGETVPEKHRKSPSAASNAWLNGYTAARLSGLPTAQTGPIQTGPAQTGPAGPEPGRPEADRSEADRSTERSP